MTSRMEAKALRPLTILVVNGPNLNMLGEREPSIYGEDTLADIEHRLRAKAAQDGHRVVCYQSNHEGQVLEFLQQWRKEADGVVINPGAWTHTSAALHDCLLGIGLPAIEMHISYLPKRESFRQTSLTAPACRAQIQGFGTYGYELALQGLLHMLCNEQEGDINGCD